MVVDTWHLTHSATACPTLDRLVSDGVLRTDQNVIDPWRHTYVLACDAGHVRVTSLGPDGKLGTADDISSPR